MPRTARGSAPVRFAFWIQAAQLNASFRLMRQSEDCDSKLVSHRVAQRLAGALRK
jgi:hypothetical protein